MSDSKSSAAELGLSEKKSFSGESETSLGLEGNTTPEGNGIPPKRKRERVSANGKTFLFEK